MVLDFSEAEDGMIVDDSPFLIEDEESWIIDIPEEQVKVSWWAIDAIDASFIVFTLAILFLCDMPVHPLYSTFNQPTGNWNTELVTKMAILMQDDSQSYGDGSYTVIGSYMG
jgi:hypothetical protein